MNMYAYVKNNPFGFVDPWGLCKEGDGIGWKIADGAYSFGVEMARATKEFGHAVKGNVWAMEYGATKAIDWALGPLSDVGNIPDFTVPATSHNQQFVVPTSKIGAVAETVDMYLGDWLERHAADSKALMEWHFSQ